MLRDSGLTNSIERCLRTIQDLWSSDRILDRIKAVPGKLLVEGGVGVVLGCLFATIGYGFNYAFELLTGRSLFPDLSTFPTVAVGASVIMTGFLFCSLIRKVDD